MFGFGRVRQSSARSLEILETEERSASKLIKHDSLSIYEETIMKLKEGSRRNPTLIPDDSGKTTASCTSSSISHDDNKAMVIDTYILNDSTPSSSDCQSMGASKERNVSIVQLFSRYKNSHNAVSSPDEETLTTERSCSSSSISPTPGNCHLISSIRLYLQQEGDCSSPAL